MFPQFPQMQSQFQRAPFGQPQGFQGQGGLPPTRFANLPPPGFGQSWPNTNPSDLQQSGPSVVGGAFNPGDAAPNSPGGLTQFGGGGLPGSVWGEGAGRVPMIGPGQYQQPTPGQLRNFGSGALGVPNWGVTHNANTYASPVGRLTSPLGNRFNPSYSPYGMNPFAAQADSYGMLANSPYAGRMNQMAMGMGSYTPSQSQWFSHYPIYDDIRRRQVHRNNGTGGFNRGPVDTFDRHRGITPGNNPFFSMTSADQNGIQGWQIQQQEMLNQFYGG